MDLENKYSLAINTALPVGQLCLFKGHECIEDTQWSKKGSHSEVVTDVFEQALSQNKLDASQINSIFCVNGPGSFTGIRVGVNFSKALAYSFNLPVIPINSLDLLSLNSAVDDVKIVCVLDAQKNSVFVSEYTQQVGRLTAVYTNYLYSIEQLDRVFDAPKMLLGGGLQRYQSFLTPNLKDKIIDKKCLMEPDLKKIFDVRYPVNFNNQTWSELKPLYIKTSAAEEKREPTKFN